jgi:hypothetical protein
MLPHYHTPSSEATFQAPMTHVNIFRSEWPQESLPEVMEMSQDTLYISMDFRLWETLLTQTSNCIFIGYRSEVCVKVGWSDWGKL